MNYIPFISLKKKPYFFLIFIVVLVFANTLFNDYNLDDNLVTKNHHLNSQGISAIKQIFTQPYYSDNMGYSYGYRPIVHLSFALENQFFGENVFISHLFNLIFYCLSVLLLFKLLNKWVGEKNKIIALFASILFAVHPIHSEVVASIKNRDEILAFLFMLLSALSVHRYLDKKTYLSLLSIFLFFTIGMLSKKSIFPMAFFLPIIYFLLCKIEINKIFSISLVFIIPSTIIATDFHFLYSIQLIAIQLIGLILFFLLKKYYSNIILIFKQHAKYHYKILITFSWIFACCFLYFNIVYFFILSILLLIFCLIKDESNITIHLILQFALIGFVKEEYDLKLFSIFLLLYVYSSVLFLNKKDWIIMALGCFLIILFLFYHHTVANILTLLTFVIFFYLVHKNKVWALVLSIISIFISIIFFKFSVFLFLLLVISISHFVHFNKSEKTCSSYLPILFLLIIFTHTILFSSNIFFKLIPLNTFHNSIVENSSLQQNINNPRAISAFHTKEGRSLQFVENTLIAPHTFSETVGTGLVTIGTYLKLLLWPAELSFYYGFASMRTYGFAEKQVFCYLIILVSLLIFSIRSFKKHPFILIGYIWFLCSIILFSNWVELVAGMVGERLAFNASAGFCLFIVASINCFIPKLFFKQFSIVEFLFIFLVLVLSVRTIFRNADWKDPLTLMRKDIQHLNESAQAHNLLALNLMEVSTSQSSPDSSVNFNLQLEAIQHFNIATKIYPSFFNVWYDLGRVYTLHSNLSLAKSAFEKAYAIDNNSLLVLEELIKTCFNLKLVNELEFYGNTYLKKDQYNEMVHELLSYIMFLNNKYEKSIYFAKNGLKYYPKNRNLQLILLNNKK